MKVLKEVTAEELKSRLARQEDLLIIDVRERWEYEEYNIGASNIPLGDLPHNLSGLPLDKGAEIILHCQSGKRSYQAQKYLGWQGFDNVKSLKGGIEAFINCN